VQARGYFACGLQRQSGSATSRSPGWISRGRSHAVNQHGKWAIVKSNAGTGPPQKGKYQVYAGTLSGTPGPKGAIVFDQVFASQFNGQSVSITGTATFFEPKGSYSGAISGTNGAHGPNATVKITKGFGLYKGAAGKVSSPARGVR
jgi:hypothetical protein